jgi:hydrogenase expression/formation protein HypE
MSLALVIQEGFSIERLGRLMASAGAAARAAGVAVVTGDTKVVERAACDGLIVTSAGVGSVHPAARLDARRVQPGDAIVLSGPLGEHGLAVMGQRSGLGLSLDLQSDVAPLWPLAKALLDGLGDELKWMRDPTRGGLAATLVELSSACGCGIELRERDIPVNRTAASAAAILGLDLLSVANEGKLVAVVSAPAALAAVATLRRFKIAARAAVVGRVGRRGQAELVELLTRAGGRRVVQMPYGEDLPRIC